MDDTKFRDDMRGALESLVGLAKKPPRVTGRDVYGLDVTTTDYTDMCDFFGESITYTQTMACELLSKALSGDMRAYNEVKALMASDHTV